MSKFLIVWCVTLWMIGALSSCVSYSTKYKGDWDRLPKNDNPYYTVYLLGDAGNSSIMEDNKVFVHLKQELDKENENSAIVWLGDNIYPVGLAPNKSVYYAEGRNKLMAQLKTMINFKGKKFFVPGNHDWYTFGRVGLRRQELLVDSFLLNTPNYSNQTNFFLPDKGCGDPQVVELVDGVKLLLMDSHWYLNEEVRKGDQSVCEVSTPKEFLDKLNKEIELNKNNALIVASHHPPYTYAHHGGKFPIKSDVFPLTQKYSWAYLPMPMSGYIFNRMRLRVSEQDVYHPAYLSYKNSLIQSLENNGRSIIASGHEHTLQFIENHNQYFIVSGSASKTNKVGMGKGSKFGTGVQGYVKIIFSDPKTAKVQFVTPGQFSEFENIAYEKVIELY